VIVVRYLALAALTVWLGSMSVLGVLVLPTIGRALQTADGHLLPSGVLSEVLRLFHLLAYACGAVLLICLFVIKFVGPPPRAFKLRAVLVALMLAIALYSGIGLTREMTAIQSRVTVPVSGLSDSDPQRTRFDRLHATASTLLVINVTLGLVLLSWYVRE
jgi:hypothetical protein